MNHKSKSFLTILVVDDNPLELGLIRLVIQKNFPELKILNLTKAPDWNLILKTETIDVIIIDYRLPEKNGIEHIKEIRKYNSDIPVFLITALERDEIDQDIFKAGATDLIVKDRNYSNLVSKLSDIILKRTFKKFELEIDILKKIITKFSELLILKIDDEENCLEVIGDQKKFEWFTLDNLLGKGWKETFNIELNDLLNEMNQKQIDFLENKIVNFNFNQNLISFKFHLIRSDNFYLIIQN